VATGISPFSAGSRRSDSGRIVGYTEVAIEVSELSICPLSDPPASWVHYGNARARQRTRHTGLSDSRMIYSKELIPRVLGGTDEANLQSRLFSDHCSWDLALLSQEPVEGPNVFGDLSYPRINLICEPRWLAREERRSF
jgi:hypothetical protein